MPKKIAYMLTTWPSRTETFAAREISLLRRRGFSITILAAAGEAPPPPFFSRPAWWALLYLTRKYPLAWLKLFILISRLMVSHPVEALRLVKNLSTMAHYTYLLDRLNIQHLHAYFFNWPATMALAIRCVSGRTFSLSAHARDLFVEAGALNLKVSSAAFVTTCSRHGLTFLKNHLPPDLHHKCHLIYHGLDTTDRFRLCRKSVTPAEAGVHWFGIPVRPRCPWIPACAGMTRFVSFPTKPGLSLRTDRKKTITPRLLTIARLVPKKGLPVLLHAFEQVKRTSLDAQLIILGQGPQRRHLQQLADRLKIAPAVQFLGHLPNHQLSRFYHSASMLIVPSVRAGDADRDGIPNVILEAFASRLPVIATATGGISEAVIHRKTGLLVAPDRPDELARMISALLDDRALQKTLTQNAAHFLTKRFNLEKNLKPLMALFQEVRP